MSCREHMERIVRSLQFGVEKGEAMAKTVLANYAPELIDMGVDMDRMHAENERLASIVNLIELKNERDELKQRVANLEAAQPGSDVAPAAFHALR